MNECEAPVEFNTPSLIRQKITASCSPWRCWLGTPLSSHQANKRR